MKKIKLTQGKYALVDDEDFEYLNQWKWSARLTYTNWYAIRNSEYIKGKNRVTILMHRQIMKLKSGEYVDHVDRNGLNNQKSNLRMCSIGQNNFNKTSMPNSSSKYKGVSYLKRLRKWQAEIRYHGKRKYLGVFEKEKDAARAYNEAAKKYHGEFANLNKI